MVSHHVAIAGGSGGLGRTLTSELCNDEEINVYVLGRKVSSTRLRTTACLRPENVLAASTTQMVTYNCSRALRHPWPRRHDGFKRPTTASTRYPSS